MITTFQALAVALLAVLPGASYTFAYERVAGAFGVTLSDRVIRFLAASAVFGALASGPALALYKSWVRSARLDLGSVAARQVEVAAVIYVAVPIAIGSVVGRGAKKRWLWLRPFIGDSPEPRAWDYLWRLDLRAVVRAKLKSGSWIAGVFGADESARRSYASGYPESADIFLSIQLRIDPETGDLIQDEEGATVAADPQTGLLLRWDEIEYLEVQEF